MFLFFWFLGLMIFKALLLRYDSVQFDNTRSARVKEMLSYMDTSVDPCDDFYQFACGNWEKFNTIPEDAVENSEFAKLNVKLLSQVRGLLEEPVGESYSAVEKKAKDFYISCTNLDILKRRGLQPLLNFLDTCGGWPLLNSSWTGTYFDWLDVVTKMKSEYGVNILLSVRVFDDLRNVNQNQIYISETPTTLPNKDYYYKPEKKYQLSAYKEYMYEVFKLFYVAEEQARSVVMEIIQFETDIAMGTIDKNIRPNLQELLLPMTVNDLQTNYPEINWQNFIKKSLDISVNKTQLITVVGDSYIPHLLKTIASVNKRVIANYIMWMVTKSFLGYIDDRFDAAEQKYAEAVVGSHKQAERWKDCISSTKETFGFALGNMYIRKYFDQETESGVKRLTKLIRETFQDSLRNINWIDGETLKRVHEKSEKMQLVVGYSEYIMSEDNLEKEYKDIQIDSEKYFENVLSVLKNLQMEERRKIHKEVDKNARFYPVTANAFYEANRNRIIIPAGILQYPIYNRYFPKASNFGQIGAIIAHELVHGFDDIGQNFDPNGTMINWWNPDSLKNFKNRTECFVSQYNNYTYNGYKLRGEVSVGENIADLGGLRNAFYAYKIWLLKQPNEVQELEVLSGLDYTPTQLFLLSYAQVWCDAQKAQALRNNIYVDNHIPAKYRVIGALSNLDEFSEEFQCPLGSNMNPKKKCKMW